MGIPVVANDTKATRDYIVDGVNGLVSPARDSARLSRNIVALMEDRELRGRLGTAARAIADEI